MSGRPGFRQALSNLRTIASLSAVRSAVHDALRLIPKTPERVWATRARAGDGAMREGDYWSAVTGLTLPPGAGAGAFVCARGAGGRSAAPGRAAGRSRPPSTLAG